MVVVGIFQSEANEERAIRLAGADTDEIYHERIGPHETLLSIRAHDRAEAEHFCGILSRAGSQDVKIDAEAA